MATPKIKTKETEPIEGELELEPLQPGPVQHVPAEVPEATGSLMTVIERVSQMPDIDLDRVERLFKMHEEMQNRLSEQLFNESMAKAQGEIQSVVVNRYNDFTKAGYADLDAIHKEAKPCWTRHGFSVFSRDTPSELDGFIHIITEVRHSAGHKEILEGDWPLDIAGKDGTKNKTPIQAIGSTKSYARRYNELGAFDVAIAREDNDGNAPDGPDITDWLTVIDDCTSMGELQKQFKEAYKYASGHKETLSKLTRAKDAKKKELLS